VYDIFNIIRLFPYLMISPNLKLQEKTMKIEFESNRNVGIGGSDVAAILGMSPYKSALELWAEKVGHTENSTRDAIHLRFGHHVEPFVANEFERLTKLHTVEHTCAIHHPENNFMYAHVDRFVVEEAWAPAVVDGVVVAKSLLECKTASVFNKDEWGQAGSDEIPKAYLLQCIWYMAMTGCSTAHVAVLIGNADFRIYQINRQEKLERMVIDQAKRFWFEHVLEGRPPKPQSTSDLKLLYPQSSQGQAIEASAPVLEALKNLREVQEEAKNLEVKAELIKTQIMAELGEAELIAHQGQVLATWKAPKPTQRIDTTKLKHEFPQIASQCTVSTPASRRFVVKELS